MFRKLSIVTALSATLVVGGAFQNSVDASASADHPQSQSYKVYYSVNAIWGTYSTSNINGLFNNVQHVSGNGDLNFNQVQQVDQPKQEEVEKPEQKEKQPEQEEQPTKAEQPEQKEEQPAEVEQPEEKEEQPAKVEQSEEKEEQSAEAEQSEQKEEQSTKAEQPEEKEEQPTEAEQPEQKEEQPIKEEQSEAPAPQQSNNNQEQQDQSQEQSQQLSQFEQEVVELTNAEREKHGLSPLEIDTELSKVARDKSLDMAENNYFSHDSPNYGSPFDMMQSYGVDYRTAGENIARGQTTPEQVVNGWMNSDGHRANILNGDFTHIGVGFVEQGNHWTQQFIGK
ncbi:CAP domain-containing protein [Virgibacillus natechei]|uniref:CAP domain-containing protein n=1 Tax=Virgibacillus sp. CBA3643 TaxID=2942278 RepID=UPI0035A357B0